jgi:hypothetical protein
MSLKPLDKSRFFTATSKKVRGTKAKIFSPLSHHVQNSRKWLIKK